MNDERFYEAMNIICDDIEEARNDSSTTDVEIAATVVRSLIEEGLLATREGWTIAGTNAGEGWQFGLEWDNRDAAQFFLDSEPWTREQGGRLIRRFVSEWQEVTE